METTKLFEFFTPLEAVLMATIVSVVGFTIYVAKLFLKYMDKVNSERAEEIRESVKVNTSLEKTIERHNVLVEKLPERMEQIFLLVKHKGS
jgi:hypothetical protein